MTAPLAYGANMNYNGTPSTTGWFNVLNVGTPLITYFLGGVNFSTTLTSGLTYYEFSPYIFTTNVITIPLITDYALSILMVVTPQTIVTGSVYTKTQLVGLTCYLQTFRLNLLGTIAANNQVVNQPNFMQSLYNVTTEINNSDNAIQLGGDISSSQAAIDRGTYLRTNQNNFF